MSNDFGSFIGALFALTFGAGLIWLVARMFRKKKPSNGYVEVPCGPIPHAKSFRWKREGLPQEGFEVTFILQKKSGPHFSKKRVHWHPKTSISIEATPDAVTIDGERYRRGVNDFKGFFLKQSQSERGAAIPSSRLYFHYGGASGYLGLWDWWSDLPEQDIQDLVAALNDSIRNIPVTGSGQQADTAQLRNDRLSDF